MSSKPLVSSKTQGRMQKAHGGGERDRDVWPKLAVGCCILSVKTEALNVNLTVELRRYLKDQVRAGRYQDEQEVVRDAIRQMQQPEIEQSERLFGG